MHDKPEVAATLYRSLAEGDKDTILSLLDPGFRGRTTAGLPLELGGTYNGPLAMLRDFWGAIARAYDAAAYPTEYLPLSDNRLLVCGTYRGVARGSGRKFEAEFTHILRFTDGRVSELIQLTDSAQWTAALEPSDTE
ncbi:nuclear transport factor 2 family protein [Rhodococcus pyridinivorans]|uniref:nuclear transport factor 2 family protein n=1 Tax=Rhodococcus pyridinivorans TaxID=103816 RepID=UPI0022275C8C|nr:nuclear transport factor 2 family protein [Rhodococcus pyridinivorans]MCW3472817.1 nuclear transport factor 2 family protein [Rhodococcus pyridinivorans]